MAGWQIETEHCGVLTPKSAAKALKQLYKEEFPSKILSGLRCQDDAYLRSCASGRSDVTESLGQRLAAYLDKRAAKKEAASAATETTQNSTAEDAEKETSTDIVPHDEGATTTETATTTTTGSTTETTEDRTGQSGKLPPVMIDDVNLQIKSRAWLQKKVVEQHAHIAELDEALEAALSEKAWLQTQAEKAGTADLEEKLKEAQAESKQQQAQIENLEAMLDSSRETVKQLRERLNGLAPVTADSAARIADLELRLAEAQEQNANLRNTVKELSECEERAVALEAEHVRDLEPIRDLVRQLIRLDITA